MFRQNRLRRLVLDDCSAGWLFGFATPRKDVREVGVDYAFGCPKRKGPDFVFVLNFDAKASVGLFGQEAKPSARAEGRRVGSNGARLVERGVEGRGGGGGGDWTGRGGGGGG